MSDTEDLGIAHHAEFDDALAAAFAEIEAAAKDNKGNYGKYADLASVTDSIRVPLTKHGFSWPQTISMSEDGKTVVVTTHLRRRGVSLTSELPMPIGKAGPHGIGSAITYARRYALAALCGVCPDDDDGQAAQDSAPDQYASRQRQQRRQQPQQQGSWRENASPEVLAWDKQMRPLARRRMELSEQSGLKRPNTQKRMVEILGFDIHGDPRRLSPPQREKVLKAFRDDIDDLELTLETEQAESAEKGAA